jgi:DNA-binding protein HU-beta
MNKTEFLDTVSKKLAKQGVELPKKHIDVIFKTIFETITAILKKRLSFTIPKFGTFKTTKRAARNGRNPQTGETIKIKAKTLPTFRASSALKEKI